MDLRPNAAVAQPDQEHEDVPHKAEENPPISHQTEEHQRTPHSSRVKTSVTLDRQVALEARAYVNAQQLRYARGERESNYSFSQLFNDALSQYLTQKGEGHEIRD